MVNAVKRWLPVVQSELKVQKVPLPAELILSIIKVESAGKPGLVNKKSGASGLMQVMPVTVKDFNQRHKTSYSMDDMRGKTDESARRQIRVGVATVANFWKGAHRYLKDVWSTIPVDELAYIADLFYVAGPGATRTRLKKLSDPTRANIEARFPKWNALPHPRKVLADPKPWNLPAIQSWLSGAQGKIEKIIKDPRGGFALGILILMMAYYLMKKGPKK